MIVERPALSALVTVDQAADLLTRETGVVYGANFVRRLLRDGVLPRKTHGRLIYIPRASVERYLAALLADDADHDDR